MPSRRATLIAGAAHSLAGLAARHSAAQADDYFGGSSSLLLSQPLSLLLSQPFGFGAGFGAFLSGFFSSELKNMR
jgi:hypothetical protein